MYDYETVSSTTSTGGSSAYLIFIFIFAVLTIVASWKLFTKAGKPGWASIIPFYCNYVQFEIAGMSGWMFLLMFIPIANFIASILLYVNLAKVFGKGVGYTLGLIFLNPIFTLLLGFGSAQYIGPQK